ncbi:v-type proton atpase catalytic subunit a [Holotrichia oblita]|nr:v-type proton atpase catalytic subunit a [Holotrichia oblita]
MSEGIIHGINGPVLTVVDCDDFHMSEMVYVSDERLIGEIISINRDSAVVQVFEETSGLRPGDRVIGTGAQLSVTLGPGIISNIFDGIQRPLRAIERESGIFISRGVHVESLDKDRKWEVFMTVVDGDFVKQGDICAEIPETSSVLNKVMIPHGITGKVKTAVRNGSYTAEDVLLYVVDENGKEHPVKMYQKWPIRVPRPVNRRMQVSRPLITGQRVIDTLFPIAKGGMAAVPGGFGTGKTMTQHQLAKWSDADIIIYVGCGERGNEMTQVLEEFSELKDPRTGLELMARTMLIANTSNMPVAAREASIYTGITIAEYYRDMGYHVAIMADSTSRWAEALRELSGRLEEMPAEEGFPAYLSSRLSSFYERAGYVETLNGKEGSVTIIGAVSPQGGDFSEPVTQNTKRFVRCFWTLDKSLAYARHFPAIQWLTSYSEYIDDMESWYAENVSPEFLKYRTDILRLLQEESELMEIVKLIGSDVLPDSQRLVLEISRVVRLGFIQQNAYHKFDTYVPYNKQMKMMEIMMHLYDKAKQLVATGIPISDLKRSGIFEEIIGIKFNVGNDEPEKMESYFGIVDDFYKRMVEQHS